MKNSKQKSVNTTILLVIFYLSILSSCNSNDNKSLDKENYLVGRWKCVKHDYSGYQKFTLEQAEQIRKATLIISKTKVYYEGIEFIEPICEYETFILQKFDTSTYYGITLERIHSKSELSKTFWVEFLGSNVDPTCFNDCSNFLLKQDTLISFCGGYTFYLVKIKE